MADGKSQRINSWSFLCAEKGWSWAWRDVRCVRHCEKASRSVLSIISPLNYFKKYQNIICAQHGLEIPIIPEFWVLLYVYIFFFKKYPYSLSLKESLMCHFLTLSRQECCCDIWLKIEIGKSPTLWILLRIFHPPAHLANKRTIFPAKIHFCHSSHWKCPNRTFFGTFCNILEESRIQPLVEIRPTLSNIKRIRITILNSYSSHFHTF